MIFVIGGGGWIQSITVPRDPTAYFRLVNSEADRQSLERAAWPTLRNSDLAMPERAQAGFDLILSWFCRSLKEWDSRPLPGIHPRFEEYAAGILAQQDLGHPDVAEQLRARFGTDPDLLEPGETQWYPREMREELRVSPGPDAPGPQH